MADKKIKFNSLKEKGPVGKREEIVLRKNVKKKLDVPKLVGPLTSVGILTLDELKTLIDISKEKEIAMAYLIAIVLDSGRDAFLKFMEALRMADYGDLATDMERELKNTKLPPETENSSSYQDEKKSPPETKDSSSNSGDNSGVTWSKVFKAADIGLDLASKACNVYRIGSELHGPVKSALGLGSPESLRSSGSRRFVADDLSSSLSGLNRLYRLNQISGTDSQASNLALITDILRPKNIDTDPFKLMSPHSIAIFGMMMKEFPL